MPGWRELGPTVLLPFGFSMGMMVQAGPVSVDEPPLDDKDVLLVTVYVDRTALPELMGAIPGRGTHFIPLGELCHRLGLGIRVHPIQGIAEGFFISTRRTFRLDPKTLAAQVEAQTIPFKPGQVELLNGDLYVDVGLLPKWFPMGVELDSKGSALLLAPKEALPIQANWTRNQQYASLGARGTGPGGMDPVPGVPLRDPYHFLDLPMVDLTLNAQHQSGSKTRTWGGTATLGGDVLWMSGLGTFNRDSSGRANNARYTLFREDPAGTGGFLGIKRINLGDLLTVPGLDVVGNLPMGRGLLIDNYPIAYRSSFAKRAFRGPLPDGWSVELYQNGALLGFRRAEGGAGYEFADVAMRFGLNQFRLVFHGPLGERREENYRYDISNELPAPGQVFYRLVGVRPTLDPFSDPLASAPQAEEDRYVDRMGELEIGFSRSAAMRAGYLSSSEKGQRKDFAVAGLTAMMPYLVTRLNAAVEKRPESSAEKGRALEMQLLTGVGYATFSLRRAEYRQGFQPLQGAGFGGGPMKSQSELTAQVPAGMLKLPFSTSLSHREYVGVDGKRVAQDRVILSESFKRLNLSVSISKDTGDVQVNPGTAFNFMCSAYLGKFSSQGEVAYSKTQGRYQIQEWSGLLDFRDAREILYRIRVNGHVANKQSPGVQVSANRLLGRFAFALSAQYSKGAGASMGLNLGLSVGREPRSGRWITTAQQLTGAGSLSIQAYRDSNGNGRRDPGESEIEDAQFKLSGGSVQSQIRDAKTTFLAGVGRSQELRLELEETSLPDAALHAGVSAFQVLPRAGHVQKVDYPVVLLGEINGTTRLRRGREMATDLGGLEVEVVTHEGRLIQRLRSAFDGFFEFLRLVPGEYVLRVSPDEVKRLGLKTSPERKFTIDAKRNLLDGVDLVVEAPAPPDGTDGEAKGQAPASIPGQVGPSQALSAPGAAAGTAVQVADRPTTAAKEAGRLTVPLRPPSLMPPADLAPMASGAMPKLPRVPKVPLARLSALPESPAGGRGATQEGLGLRTFWTVVVVSANRDETISQALQSLGPIGGSAFVRPCSYPKPSRQVCLGRFDRMEDAKRAIQTLPDIFFMDGNRPYVLRIPAPMEGGVR